MLLFALLRDGKYTDFTVKKSRYIHFCWSPLVHRTGPQTQTLSQFDFSGRKGTGPAPGDPHFWFQTTPGAAGNFLNLMDDKAHFPAISDMPYNNPHKCTDSN